MQGLGSALRRLGYLGSMLSDRQRQTLGSRCYLSGARAICVAIFVHIAQGTLNIELGKCLALVRRLHQASFALKLSDEYLLPVF